MKRKTELALPTGKFAREVTTVSRRARPLGTHTLGVGHVVYAVDGVKTDPLVTRYDLYPSIQNRRSPSHAGTTEKVPSRRFTPAAADF